MILKNQTVRKWAKYHFVLVATAILLFEEFVWFSLLALMTKIGHLPVFKQIEAWMGGLGKWGSLGLFVLPGAALFPVKIFAMWLMGANHPVLGAATFVLAKIVGTALFARIYTIAEPKVMQFERLRKWRDAFLRLRKKLHDWLHEQPFYVKTKVLVARIREDFRNTREHWAKRRLRAAKIQARRNRDRD